MNEPDLRHMFYQIRYLSLEVPARCLLDSVVVTCCTQFDLRYDQDGLSGVIDLCGRIDKNLIGDSAPKRALRQLVRHLRDRSLARMSRPRA